MRNYSSKGYVYILNNDSMPGLVKIGRSAKGGAMRAIAINGTGVPSPFCMVFECFFEDCYEAELLVHEKLHKYRINKKREFFKINEIDAIRAVLQVATAEIDCVVADADFVVSDADMWMIAARFDLCPPEPYAIVSYISDNAWISAINKYNEIKSVKLRQAGA